MSFTMSPARSASKGKGINWFFLSALIGTALVAAFLMLRSTDKKKAQVPSVTPGPSSLQAGLANVPSTIDGYKKDLTQTAAFDKQNAVRSSLSSSPGQPPPTPAYASYCMNPAPSASTEPRTLPPDAYTQPGYAPHPVTATGNLQASAPVNPVDQQRTELARDREKKFYADRYGSNIALSRRTSSAATETPVATPVSAPQSALPPFVQAQLAALSAAQNAPTGDKTVSKSTTSTDAPNKPKRPVHEPGTFLVTEGTALDCVLQTRLDGTFAGPVKVMVTTPLYDRSRQMILVPAGSVLLGEVRPVQKLGEERLAVSFHRLLRTDGINVDLDKFVGLDQIGETALKDLVNHHYVQIFGTSVALAAVSGLSTASSGSAITSGGFDQYRQGFGESLDQSSTRILDKYTNILPTITIREGTRVKVYFTNDLYLPPSNNAPILD